MEHHEANNFILGVFKDEDHVTHGCEAILSEGVNIHEVYSPFPVHGLDEVLGYERSRLPIVAFIFGALGTTLALTMMFYMMNIDWPMIIGGKNTYSVTFVPITFEMTVLLAALGMVGTFLLRADMKPWADPRIFDLRSTDDKHIVAIDLDDNNLSAEKLKAVLSKAGAEEVNYKNFAH